MNAEWFAGRLRELRVAAGLTQQELAERIGVRLGAISRWEAGRREPSWSNILALCAALGVSCEEFRKEPQPAPSLERGRPRKASADPEADKPARTKRKT